jgi:hypothetical protein
MNAQIRNFLTIALKNAINALLTSSSLMALNWGAFNFTSRAGWWNLGKACLSVIAAREATVWLPLLLKWSVTSANPNAARLPSGGLQVPPPQP